MDQNGSSSSSFFSRQFFLPSQRQVGFSMPDHHGANAISQTFGSMSVVSSPLQKILPAGAQSMGSLELPQPPTVSDQNNAYLLVQPGPYIVDGDKDGENGAQHQQSPFSSSLSEIFKKNVRLSSNDFLFRQSVNAVASHDVEEEPFEAGEEIEAQIIRNLLPDDDDDLFSGVFDEPKYIAQPNIGADTGDFDLFSSVGGMELEGDDGGQRFSDSSVVGLNAGEHHYGEHPYGEHPSRTLFVRNINSNVEDAELKVLFERYGDIRTLFTACKHRGFVMISYYDIRAAQKAIRELQHKPLKHRKLDIHYSIPKDNPSDKDINQGTLVVFNLDSSISNGHLHQIFGVHGEIKEIRETPHKLSHRFIEFYDVRAAEAALRALNRTDVAGRRIKLEPSRPGGSRRNVQPFSPEREKKESDVNQKEGSPPNNSPSRGAITSSPLMENGFHRGIPSSVPPPSLLRVASVGNQSCQMPGVGPYGHFVEVNGAFGSSGNMCCPLHQPHYEWKISNPCHPHLLSPLMLPNSPPFFNGVNIHPLPQLHGPPIAPSNIINAHHHDVGSAPAINYSLLGRRHAYAGMSPEASVFQPISFEGMGISVDSTLHPSGLTSPNIFPHIGGNSMDSLISSTNIGLHYSPQHRGCMFDERNLVIPLSNSFDAPNEWVKSRNEADSNQIGSRKEYELDIPRILSGKDIRTTIMLKNIPNKYTSKMLVAKLDEQNRALYDFLYLPIDFKNKCNMGYAFINMIDPLQIISLYETFNGKKWEKFNSEKVASLAYARIQGKEALIEHFDNSTVMNEERRYRPILFHSDGPNAGDEEPFPVMDKTLCRAGEPRGTYKEKKHEESPPASANGEESSDGRDSS